MKIAVTGSRGRVGRYLVKRGVLPFLADVTDLVDVDKEMERTRPDILIHLAAHSDVDWCEKEENRKKVTDTNVFGTFNVCEMAEKYNCRVVFLSSCYVFSGKRWWGKYSENSNILYPSNHYGFSKMSAEMFQYRFGNMKIVRTSHLFDYERLASELSVLKLGTPKSYPTFFKRSFLYIPHFVEMLMEYCRRINDMPDILHLSGCDTVSHYTFMQYVAKAYSIDSELVLPRRKDLKNGFANRGYRLGLDTRLSESIGFRQYSYQEGIEEMACA